MAVAAENPTKSAASGAAMLRIPSDKISRLMDLIGELSLNVSATIHSHDVDGRDLSEFEAASHRLKMVVREVQDAAIELRLVEISEVFRRLRRMIREIERETGKKIRLDLLGEDTAIDKVVADRIYEPLVHVVRNAADHGLEPPEERVLAGKPETGVITLAANQVGSEVQITVSDDGRGLNRDRILQIARKRGLVGATEEPEGSALWKVIFEPGFSTAETISNLSGRGVGMDVLNTTMRDLRGRITVDSQESAGTDVGLFIPVSLAFLDCIITRMGESLFAVPIDVVLEILQVGVSDYVSISAGQNGRMMKLREEFIPLIHLDNYYANTSSNDYDLSEMVVVVLNSTSGPIGVPVDEIIDRQQVVMKPLSGTLTQVRASSGCALLGTGEVALVLDSERLASGVSQ